MSWRVGISGSAHLLEGCGVEPLWWYEFSYIKWDVRRLGTDKSERVSGIAEPCLPLVMWEVWGSQPLVEHLHYGINIKWSHTPTSATCMTISACIGARSLEHCVQWSTVVSRHLEWTHFLLGYQQIPLTYCCAHIVNLNLLKWLVLQYSQICHLPLMAICLMWPGCFWPSTTNSLS
jgi:hypothetical protein